MYISSQIPPIHNNPFITTRHRVPPPILLVALVAERQNHRGGSVGVLVPRRANSVQQHWGCRMPWVGRGEHQGL